MDAASGSGPQDIDSRHRSRPSASRPDFTIITPTYNSGRTVADTIHSIRDQCDVTVQHILIDGASNDSTLDIAQAMPEPPEITVSEPDTGLYAAINKGMALATGTHIGILNGDDRYANDQVLSTYRARFRQGDVDAIYSDLVFVNDHDARVRKYRSSRFSPARIRWGWMPAHPTLIVTRQLASLVGDYETSYRIAGDYDWVIRAFLTHECCHAHLPIESVLMRTGGISTSGLRARIDLNRETMQALRSHGVKTNWPMLLSKYPLKMWDALWKR